MWSYDIIDQVQKFILEFEINKLLYFVSIHWHNLITLLRDKPKRELGQEPRALHACGHAENERKSEVGLAGAT